MNLLDKKYDFTENDKFATNYPSVTLTRHLFNLNFETLACLSLETLA